GLHRPLSAAVRGFPIAGALIGAIGGLTLMAAQSAGLPATAAAVVALLAIVLVTGGLHEDGLADVADGFGSGAEKDRKLEIMRDSRIGTYGVLALIFVVLIKVACLATIVNDAPAIWHVPVLLVATGALSRTFVVLMMHRLPAARQDGRSVEAGRPPDTAVNQSLAAGMIICAAAMWLACGWWTIIASALAGSIAYYIVKRRAMYHIGGQTGDVLGAVQQSTETAMFMAIASVHC
ncbi:MAG: adenosylcobinamide-GDP ribazoletransferase, partial [Aestuariivirgaceae bacterium]